ncbi:MAG: 50S ribosomal protein L23 [Candidatus Omnitrophica bacterium]|nr:50S ribosomal protein L23 [Candidatus Omnitrophota bacterium]
MEPYQVVKTLLRTEKGTFLAPENKYLFKVDIRANKILIRKAIEEIYKVKVKNVRTVIVSGKMKRLRFHEGRTPSWKKAIVQLKEGSQIATT